MIESTSLSNGLTKLTATAGLVHKTGTDTYAQSIIMLPCDTPDMYEEVAEQPAYTKEEYDNKVAELVRERYTASEEFAIQRKAINAAFSQTATSADDAALEEYHAYNTYVDECKQRAKDPAEYEVCEDAALQGETD